MRTYDENSMTDALVESSSSITSDFVNFFGKHLLGTIILEGNP